MHNGIIRLILSLLAGVATLSALCDEHYFDLKMDDRKTQVGLETRGKYAAVSHFHQVLDSGRDLRETNYTVSFELVALCKVTENRRTLLAMQVNVEHLLQKNGTNSELLLPENTVVEAKNVAGIKILSISGRPLTGKPMHALLTVLPLSQLSSCTEAELFGIRGPKRVGDSWNPNLECFLKGREMSVVGLTNVTATVKLESLEKVNGVPCFRLGVLMDLQTEAPPPGVANFKGQVVSSSMTARVGGVDLFPLDPSLPSLGEDFTADMKWELKVVREGRPMTLKTDIKEEKHWEKQILK